MPANELGVNLEGLWRVMIIGILLVLYIVLSTGRSQNPPPVDVTQPTSTSTAVVSSSTVVNITNTDPKVERAVVHILGTEQTANADQSVVSLPVACLTGQYISVWAPGYYTLTFPCTNNPAMRYDVQLEPVGSVDNPNYPWTEAELRSNPARNCASCHNGQYSNLNELKEWLTDGHSQVFTAPYFRTTYLGTNVSGQPSQQIQWDILSDGQKIYPRIDAMKPDYGAGYRLDYPVSNGNCAVCHVPASFPSTLQEANMVSLLNSSIGGHVNAATEGITCDVCHKVTDVLVGKNQMPYDDRPGILSMSFVRPSQNQQIVFGPTAYQSILDTNAKRTCYPIFSESKFCASCHYGKFANTEVYASYKEWLQSPYGAKYVRSADGQIVRENPDYRSCQDCHMIGQDKVINTLPSERDACSGINLNFRDFNHNMMNYGPDPQNPSRVIPLLVKEAAQMKLDARLEAGQIRVTVNVVNTRAGHKFPTDSPLRHLILRIEASDWRENPLTQLSGPTIPVWAAPDQAGYAGEIFANIFKDKDTNLAPSFAYWNPVENAWQNADTRLVPGIPAQSEYSFAAPYDRTATITAKLIYRRAFVNVVYQKDWPLDNLDVLVTQVTLQCTGFGEAPEHMECQPVQP